MEEFIEYTADAVVVGAGHAGCEAALALARTGMNTVMLTLNLDSIGFMPCNPSIGGTAKGHLVREIDALGGEMGRNADKTALQIRMLNVGKGAAVQSLRAQSDKNAYHREMKKTLEHTKNLRILQGEAAEILVENGACKGVKTTYGGIILCRAVVLCTGVYLNAETITGDEIKKSGPNGFAAATALTKNLVELGFSVRRFKTGTPARLDGRTVDYSACEIQEGDEEIYPFSFLSSRPPKNKLPCYLTYTNRRTHEIILENLDRSPLYNGTIQSTGPRYCPSIETKVVRFKDKERHQIFLEPEGADTSEVYVQGMSTSMPHDVQRKMYATIAGLEHADIVRYGYAIEYDCIDTLDVLPTLEFKKVQGIYTAGQINGTSGYEEAAAQGLMAGLNASLKLRGLPPFVLRRDEAYIGVLIDDLVTKGVDEPYRMFTSRAEYRILLRQDDADMRLTPLAYAVGLADEHRHDLMLEKQRLRDELIAFVEDFPVRVGQGNEILAAINNEYGYAGTQSELTPLKEGCRLKALVLRPQLNIMMLARYIPELAAQIEALAEDRREEIVEAAEVLLKYDGYIKREQLIADKIQRLESVALGDRFDYASINALSTEARQKLERIRPATVAQASRIPGVSPADINILLLLSGR